MLDSLSSELQLVPRLFAAKRDAPGMRISTSKSKSGRPALDRKLVLASAGDPAMRALHISVEGKQKRSQKVKLFIFVRICFHLHLCPQAADQDQKDKTVDMSGGN